MNTSSYPGILFGHNLSSDFSIITALCFLAILIMAVVCNGMLVACIVLTRRLHSVFHVFIVNLAISDVITATGSIPFDVEFMFRGYFSHGDIACGVMNTVFLVSLPSSVFSLTLLTAERLIGVLYPCRINQIMTKNVVVVSIITMWTYVLLVGLFPIMYNRHAVMVVQGNCFLDLPLGYNIFMLFVNFVIPIVLICGANIVLLSIAQKHCRKQTRRVTLLSHSTMSVSDRIGSRSPHSVKLTKNLKAAKRVGLLVGVFLMCWLSYIIVVASNFICWCNPQELTWIANIVNYSSTAINPILYGLLNNTIRREVRNMLRRDIQQGRIQRVVKKYKQFRLNPVYNYK